MKTKPFFQQTLFVWFAMLVGIISGCQTGNFSVLPATSTIAFTSTLTTTPTHTPTVTLTPTPTPTPTLTPTPTPFHPVGANTPLPKLVFSKIDKTNVSQLQEIAHYRSERAYSSLLTADGKWLLVKDELELLIYTYPQLELTDRQRFMGNGSLQISNDGTKALVDSHWFIKIEQGKMIEKIELGKALNLVAPNARMSADGKYLMVEGWEPNKQPGSRPFVLVDVDTMSPIYKWGGGYRTFHGIPVELSAHGRIAITRVDNAAIIWDVESKSPLIIVPSASWWEQIQVYVSEDEKFVAISSNDDFNNYITIWNVETKQKLIALTTPHNNKPGGYDIQIDFSEPTRLIAIGMKDKTSVWNLDNGVKIWETTTCGAPWTSNAPKFSPSGKFLGIASCLYGEIWKIESEKFTKTKEIELQGYYHSNDFIVSDEGQIIPLKTVLGFIGGLNAPWMRYVYDAQRDEEIFLAGEFHANVCRISLFDGKAECVRGGRLGKDFHIYKGLSERGTVNITDLTTQQEYRWNGYISPDDILVDSRYGIVFDGRGAIRDLPTGEILLKDAHSGLYNPSENLAIVYCDTEHTTWEGKYFPDGFKIFDLKSRRLKLNTDFRCDGALFISDHLLAFLQTYEDKSVPKYFVSSYLNVYNVQTGARTVVKHPTCKSWIRNITRISDTQFVAACLFGNATDHLLWVNLANNASVTDTDLGAEFNFTLDASPDGSLVAVNYSRDGESFIGIYDTATMKRIAEIPSWGNMYTEIYFSPGQKFIILVNNADPWSPQRTDVIVYGIIDKK